MLGMPVPHPPPRIVFAEAVALYERSLVDKLRGFTAGGDVNAFLERWVHDEDPGASVRSLLEAAAEHGIASIELAMTPAALDAIGPGRLAELLGAALVNRQPSDGGDVWLTLEPRQLPRLASAVSVPRKGPHEAAGARSDDDAEELRAVSFLPAAYAEALAQSAFAASLGSLEGTDAGAETVWDNVRWTIATRGEIVAAASVVCSSAPGQVATLLSFASSHFVGRSLREAREHGVARVELALRGRGGVRPVLGIVLPTRMALAFEQLQEHLDVLCTRIWRGQNPPGSNEWLDAPQDGWRLLTADEKRDTCAQVVEKTLVSAGLDAHAMTVEAVERGILVLCSQPDVATAGGKGRVLMLVERALRNNVESTLIVVTEERRDAHKGRRLKLAEEPRT